MPDSDSLQRKNKKISCDDVNNTVFVKVTNSDIYNRICIVEQKLDAFIEKNEVAHTEIYAKINFNREERKADLEKVKGSVSTIKASVAGVSILATLALGWLASHLLH